MTVPEKTRNKNRQLVCLAVIALIATIVSAPTFLYGAPYGHDMFYHLTWLRYFTAQLHAGDWYPRWLMDLNSGAGSPIFFYYAPFPFFVSGIFGPLFCPSCRTEVHLAIGLWLMLMASGIAFYAFARQFGRPRVAAVGAVVYMVLPYHLEIDLWRRFAFGEFPSYIWYPLILLFLDKTFLDRRYLPLAAACYAALFVTHLPEALLFSIFAVAYVSMQCLWRKSLRPICVLTAAAGLGLGLAALYVVPAMFAQDYTIAKQMFIPSSGAPHRLWNYEYFHYVNWMFLSGNRTPYPSFSHRLLDILLGITAVFALLCVAVFSGKRGRAFRAIGPWLLGMALVWFLVTPVSTFVWEHVSLLREVQFPWRSLPIADLAVAAMCVLALETAWQPRDRVSWAAVGLAATVLAASILSAGRHTGSLQPLPKLLEPFQTPTVIEDYAAKVAAGWDTLEFFMPIWVAMSPEEFRAAIGAVPRIDVPPGAGAVRVVRWAPRDIVLETDLGRDTEIAVKQLYFPGWRASNVRTGQELQLSPTPRMGLLAVHAPQGHYQIALRLESLWQERVGAGVSITTLIGLAVMAFVWRRRRGSDSESINAGAA